MRKMQLIVAIVATGTAVWLSAASPLIVTDIGDKKGHRFRSEHGDELIGTPVVLSDGQTVDVIGGTLPDGSGMAAPDVQPPLKVGQRVKKEKRGRGWRLVPEDSPEAGIAHAYAYGGHRWKDNTLRYFVNTTTPGPPATITPAQQEQALATAAQRWVDQTGANLTVVSAGLTTNNTIAGNHHSDIFWRDGTATSPGIAASTYFYWGADGFLFDADMVTYKGWGTFYPLTTCIAGSFRAFADEIWTHEFGHFVGFGHSTVAGATMWPSIPASCGGTWRSLAQDDIAAARAAYGAATTAPTTPTLFRPPNGASPSDAYLRWNAAAGATSYEVWLGGSLLMTVTPPGCTCVSTAYPGTLYAAYGARHGVTSWRVVAKNAVGAASSVTWSVTLP